MSFVIDKNKNITLTRGDSALFSVTLNMDGEVYEMQRGGQNRLRSQGRLRGYGMLHPQDKHNEPGIVPDRSRKHKRVEIRNVSVRCAVCCGEWIHADIH